MSHSLILAPLSDYGCSTYADLLYLRSIIIIFISFSLSNARTKDFWYKQTNVCCMWLAKYTFLGHLCRLGLQYPQSDIMSISLHCLHNFRYLDKGVQICLTFLNIYLDSRFEYISTLIFFFFFFFCVCV